MEIAFKFANSGFVRLIRAGARFRAIGFVIIRSGRVLRYAESMSATIIEGLYATPQAGSNG